MERRRFLQLCAAATVSAAASRWLHVVRGEDVSGAAGLSEISAPPPEFSLRNNQLFPRTIPGGVRTRLADVLPISHDRRHGETHRQMIGDG